ncbi:hypothetical protein KR074_003072 [Drosophila pseudoananassae]|nr:hypothetical protein KR074_003072 [Drosophila pseudoananassae]
MIKLQPPLDLSGVYHNFRCGEVLCNGPASYDVCCSLCGERLELESFPLHFRMEHLSGIKSGHDDDKATIKIEYDPIAQDTMETASDLKNQEELDEQLDQTSRRQRPKRLAAMRNTLVDYSEKPLELEMDIEWLEAEEEHVDEEDAEDEDVGGAPKDMLFQCDQCDRAYNSKRSLQSHRRQKHSLSALEKNVPGGTPEKPRRRKGPAKVYKCNEEACHQTFRTERDLRGHRWKHTGIFCDICGKPFTQSGNMIRHRQRHSGIKPHKCPECDATFYTQKELSSHSICHTGRMPCICEVCGRPCRDRGVLTAHMRRHTGERPAKCDVCGKAFYSFHDLNVHAVSHTNLRPFACDVCGSTFQRKKALRVHKLLHSEQRKYVCKLCGKSFAQSGGLNAHMRSHDPARIKGTVKPLSTPVNSVELVEVIHPNGHTPLTSGFPTTPTTITLAIDDDEGEEQVDTTPEEAVSWQL